MFRSSAIIRELALNLDKVIFIYFNIKITLAGFSASSLMMVEDRNI